MIWRKWAKMNFLSLIIGTPFLRLSATTKAVVSTQVILLAFTSFGEMSFANGEEPSERPSHHIQGPNCTAVFGLVGHTSTSYVLGTSASGGSTAQMQFPGAQIVAAPTGPSVAPSRALPSSDLAQDTGGSEGVGKEKKDGGSKKGAKKNGGSESDPNSEGKSGEVPSESRLSEALTAGTTRAWETEDGLALSTSDRFSISMDRTDIKKAMRELLILLANGVTPNEFKNGSKASTLYLAKIVKLNINGKDAHFALQMEYDEQHPLNANRQYVLDKKGKLFFIVEEGGQVRWVKFKDIPEEFGNEKEEILRRIKAELQDFSPPNSINETLSKKLGFWMRYKSFIENELKNISPDTPGFKLVALRLKAILRWAAVSTYTDLSEKRPFRQVSKNLILWPAKVLLLLFIANNFYMPPVLSVFFQTPSHMVSKEIKDQAHEAKKAKKHSPAIESASKDSKDSKDEDDELTDEQKQALDNEIKGALTGKLQPSDIQVTEGTAAASNPSSPRGTILPTTEHRIKVARENVEYILRINGDHVQIIPTNATTHQAIDAGMQSQDPVLSTAVSDHLSHHNKHSKAGGN